MGSVLLNESDGGEREESDAAGEPASEARAAGDPAAEKGSGPPSESDVLRAETFRLVDREIDQGYRPVLLCFMDRSGRVSTYSKDVDLGEFLDFLKTTVVGSQSSPLEVRGH